MKWYGIFARCFGKVNPAPGTVPVPKSAGTTLRIDETEKYRDPVYQKLVDQCAMGDIAAMLELARWHRQWAHPEGLQLLAACEQAPEAWHDLDQWFYQHRYGSDGFHIRCYITWVCRAALYGNPEAEALVERCSRFPSWSLLPESIYGLGSSAGRHISSRHFYSFELCRLGLKGIKENLDEFNIYPLTKDGIFPAYFLADYIPADSDGFGREDDYEDIFYDEFFNCLPDDKISQAPFSVEDMAKKRKAYWDDPAHDREHRMYKRLLAEEA